MASLLAESDGTLWAGLVDGRLFRIENGRFVEAPAPTPSAGDEITAIYRHRDGALWLGTNRGLVTRKDGEWKRFQVADGLASDGVHAIVGDREGAIWIGHVAGITRYRDGQFTTYHVSDGVPPGPVRAIHVDGDGVLWIGTYGGGLARLKAGVFTAYGARGGVLDTSVHRILEDEEGYLWLSGDRGIRRASKPDLDAIADGRAGSLEVTMYDEAEGMPSAECNGMASPAGWRARDGAFYFPTRSGVVRIDAHEAAGRSLPIPGVRIEEAVLSGVSAPLATPITVPPSKRDIEIRYTAPVLARAELLQFRYRLEGYHADWIDVGTRRVASFANLGPGTYRLLVEARQGGAWSEPAAAVVVVEPWLYERPWFRAALFAVALGAIVAGGRLYVARVRRRAAQLEQAVAERTVQLSAAHERLSDAHGSLSEAKREVEQAHGQVLAVLNQLDIGVLVLGDRDVVRYASASAQRLLRKEEHALVGRSWSACLPLGEADRAQLQQRIERRSRTEDRVPLQMIIGGKRYWMEADVRDEPAPGRGRILYLYGVTEVVPASERGHSDGPFGLVGRSTAMRLVYRRIIDVARVDSTVLIEGETGVGKELVARAIHLTSARAEKPFVAINVAGPTESLLATQLFGHRRGAFTGAVDDHMGLFEAASGGTLFLDEVGDMPASVQASLLRVLPEHEILRIGESHPRKVDVRFLAATHRDLAREVRDGRFREDLLYRIRVATILVPPLRERIEDVPLLIETFLAEAAEPAGRAVPHLSREAIDVLMRYRWPGNVRELESVVERALVDATAAIIRPEDLPPEIVHESDTDGTSESVPIEGSERERLVEALRRANGNRAKAARLLGIGRTTLYKRLAEYSIE